MLKVWSNSCAKTTSSNTYKNIINVSREIFEYFYCNCSLSFNNSIIIVRVDVCWIGFLAKFPSSPRTFIKCVTNLSNFNKWSTPTSNTSQLNTWRIHRHENNSFYFHCITRIRNTLCVVSSTGTYYSTSFFFFS